MNPPYPAGSHRHPPFIPLGIGYLAAILEKNGYDVNVIDCQALNRTLNEVESELRKRQPDVVGLTSTTLTYKSALEIIKVAKKALPNCLTVIGGSHVTFWDDKALQECPQLDIVVRKEGEITFLELMQKLEAGKSFSDVLGITYRKGEEIVRTPDRPYIEDLDSLPFPAHHLWPLDRLRKYGNVMFPLMTSRGCVFWCEFCSAVRMFGRRFRMRSTKNVVDEIEHLHNTYGATNFTFCDDAFTVDQARTEELCEEIKRRKLKIKWNCGTRIDMLTKELLIKMKDAGCISVWSGVESGAQQILDAMAKGIHVEQTIRVFGWLRELGLKTAPNVILGFPGETKKTAWKTIKFVEKISPDYMGFYNIATPFPGTPMYDEVKEKGWLRVTDFDKYDTATPVFETPMLRMEELKEIREQAFHHFYLRPTYILRMFAKGGMHGLSATQTALEHLFKSIKLKLHRL